MFDATIFSGNLKRVRRELQLSRDMFAYRSGLSHDSISSYQSGRQMPATINFIKMCSGLSVSANNLLRGLYDQPTEQEAVDELRQKCLMVPSKYHSFLKDIMQFMIDYMVNTACSLAGANLGSRIKRIREDIGLSPESLASLCGIQVGSLSGIESSSEMPGLDTFLLICDALHISPEIPLLGNPEYLVPDMPWYKDLLPSQIKFLFSIIDLFQRHLVCT